MNRCASNTHAPESDERLSLWLDSLSEAELAAHVRNFHRHGAGKQSADAVRSRAR